jgi:hypothetical protein
VLNDLREESMRTSRWLATAAAAASISAGVAVAASQPGDTSPVTADFQADLIAQHERQCDVNHTVFRVRFEGTQTSSDPRLSGNLVVRVKSVVNNENNYGYSTGHVRISDDATGKPKFNGHVVGTLDPDGTAEGVITGRTVGPDSSRLIGNFNVQQDPTTGALTGEIGKDTLSGAVKDPAVLTNACRGGRGEHGHKGGGQGQQKHGAKPHPGKKDH